ncbi:MAG: heat shock protein GrpE [Bacteroidetes bacterium ADurb.BinA261]|jgi:molecular chaperone GrpE|nr:nucleotide exchange factor GrpE [Dysgonamonadaceae bacterium]OPZ14489.1 MAG: heat shock protein GrpE [Bacteroidetes bacterium ADurb.BinA261]
MKQRDEKYNENEKRTTNAPEKNETIDKEGVIATEETDNLTDAKPADYDQENQISQMQQQYDDLNDSYLRLHADFDNYRKRTMKEKADIIRSGGERVLSDIIPLVDDFERALKALHEAEEKDSILEGIDLIYQKFVSFLEQHGVREIESVGLPFDPDKFEAVTTVPVADESQKGKVVDCIQKGYSLNDKVIRFPKVIVGE